MGLGFTSEEHWSRRRLLVATDESRAEGTF